MGTSAHTHRWTTRSRHRTSQGVVAYGHCACGRWRVDRATTAQVEQTLAVTSAAPTEGIP
ncbi:hypothetical protein [Kribbella speibonae]|uniref:Uncharacterized protein n=1 Tax=Kribbella speibonae TaxID=1572660 RepID=A0A4R0ID54_9ACTN|nr:hypothetical protein [Kribbella speibonae]TCC24727.1 hypothetical protein E0H58_10940 [Kribbella speibonae]TCC31093.1 hypothetical protein E0H92_37780 [Kribbella speibonae]